MDVAFPAERHAAYAALRRRFLAGLAQRRAEIFEAPDAESRHQALHRLAGAAGSYGFLALSELARRAGAQAEACDHGPTLLSLKAALDGLIDAAATGDLPWKSPASPPSTTSS